MKRSMASAFAVILLCLLSTGIILYAHGQLTAQGEDVSVTETTLFGDKSEAEGITVKEKDFFSPGYNGGNAYLNWETTYTIHSGDIQPSTLFDYKKYKDEPEPETPSARLEISLSDGGYVSDDLLKELEDPEFGYTKELMPLVRETASRTAPGETHTETIQLRDHLKTIPVKYDVYGLSGDQWSNEDLQGKDVDYGYFNFPVPDDLFWNMTISKDSDGKVTDLTTETVDGAYLSVDTASVYDGSQYIYTAVTGISKGYDEMLDIPDEMCGIHQIPLNRGKKTPANRFDMLWADMDHAQKVYPLKQGQHLVKLDIDPAGENLLLFTQEKDDGSVALSVIDIKDMKLKQKLTVISGTVWKTHPDNVVLRYYDDSLLIIANNREFTRLHMNGGKYETEIQDSLQDWLPDGAYVHNITDVHKGDEMLLTVQLETDYDYMIAEECSHYLFIYKAGQLTYAGYFKNSLDDVPKGEMGGSVSPDSLTVSFKSDKETSK